MPEDANLPPEVNPYLAPTPLEPVPGDAEISPFSPPDTKRRPRVWTVFAVFVAAFFGTIALSVVGAVVLVFWYLATGGTTGDLPAEFPKFATQPGPFIFLAALGQLGIFLAAVIPAWLSPEPLLQRLGLTRPRVPLWQWPVLVFGGIIPLALGVFCAIALSWVIPPDKSVASLYEQMTPAMAIPFIFFIAIAPGVNEEMLFRGYMQRRLLERWNPWVSILVASLLFAILHIMPHTVALAFPLGIWLGVLAWRTDSTWPGIVSHATFNGAWNIYVIGTRLKYLPDPLPVWFQVVFFGIAGICFLASVVLLARMKPAVSAGTSPS
ncbi:MAG: CPBP family intramembrane glutamic endopeptidase [Pirellulaceae bacterium]